MSSLPHKTTLYNITTYTHFMGYGGALIWSGLARNLKRISPEKKIIFVYTPSIKDALLFKKNSDFEVYKNNPDITLVTSKFFWCFLRFFYQSHKITLVDLQNEKYHYWVSDSPDKMTYRQDGHAIEIACRAFNILDVDLRTKLILTKNEEFEANKILNELSLSDKKYICIEPNTKKKFTENKQWPWEHWESLVSMLRKWIDEQKKDYEIVQLGVSGSPLLKNTVNMTGRTSFRQIKHILKQSQIILANEGGIAHLASSSDVKTVVICNPSLPPNLMQYPQHINILPQKPVHNCGLKKPCPTCHELLNSIHPEIVFEKIKSLL